MMSDKQSDFRETVEKIQTIENVAGGAEIDLHRIHRDWINAAAAVQATVAGLSRQLRRYVDHSVLQEERRIYALIQQIEQQAVAVREGQPSGVFMEIDAVKPEVTLPMDRPLFTVPTSRCIKPVHVEAGQADVAIGALFDQVYVDKKTLRQKIDTMLERRERVSLAEMNEQFPITKGLTELLGYIVLADEGRTDHDELQKLVKIIMKDPQDRRKAVLLEDVVFTRAGG